MVFILLIFISLAFLFLAAIISQDKEISSFDFLLRFIAETCAYFIVGSIFVLYCVQQFADLPSGNHGAIVVWIAFLIIIIFIGGITGYKRFKNFLKENKSKRPSVYTTPSFGSEVLLSLKTAFWLYVAFNIVLIILTQVIPLSWTAELQFGLGLIAVLAVFFRRYQILRNHLEIVRKYLYIVIILLISGIGYFLVRDSLPAIANRGTWKKVYSASQVNDRKITRQLNRIYRTGSSKVEIDKFWKAYGVKGIPYVVKSSDDLYNQRHYKVAFAQNMLQQINDPVFIPELKRLMFYGLLGVTARDILFRINAQFTKDELIKLSSMPEYLTMQSIHPEFEREATKLAPDNLVDLYLPHTLTDDKWYPNTDRLPSQKEEILGFARKVSEIPSNKGLKALIKQYLVLQSRRKESFKDSQSPKKMEFYSDAGRERVLDTIKICDEFIPAYKDIIYGMVKRLGMGLIPENAPIKQPNTGISPIKFQVLSTDSNLIITVRNYSTLVTDTQKNLWDKKKVKLTDKDGDLYIKDFFFDFYGYGYCTVTLADSTGNTSEFTFDPQSPTSIQ